MNYVMYLLELGVSKTLVLTSKGCHEAIQAPTEAHSICISGTIQERTRKTARIPNTGITRGGQNG